MTAKRVLVVEDDRVINQALGDRLRAEGYDVSAAFDGPSAVEAHRRNPADVVVLDLMLPGFDGLEVCRRIQADRPVPVLMLTAKDDESDIVTGLAVGADDYLTKPFRMREVVARVKALLRRVERAAELVSEQHSPVHIGDLVVDHAAHRVFVADEERHLTPTEFDILWILAARPGQVFSRERLLSELWGWQDASAARTVDSHVRGLRGKIGAHRIRTVHGVGYAVEVPA